MTRPEALAWFVSICERLELKPKTVFAFGGPIRVGGIRAKAFRKGFVTKQELLDSADHIQGDADAWKTFEQAKKELGLTKSIS